MTLSSQQQMSSQKPKQDIVDFVLNCRVANANPSQTLAVAAKATEMVNAGHDVIDFSVGEPDLDTPQNIKDAAIKACQDGCTKYTPVPGILPLRQAICDKFFRENNIRCTPDNVIVGCGAKQLIFNALMASINDGDEVIIPAPFWVSYYEITALAGGRPVTVLCKAENNFKITADELNSVITPKTKWLIINSPNNPTGCAYHQSELQDIAAVLRNHTHVHVLSDDIYEHILFDGQKFFTLAGMDNGLDGRILTINGVSKAYAMTGWRIGYATGHGKLINAMKLLQSQSTTNACSISQYAALEALTGPQNFIDEIKTVFQRKRNLVLDSLKNAPGIKYHKPMGAFYVFIDFSALLGMSFKKICDNNNINEDVVMHSSVDLCNYLLEQYKVAMVPGEAFGAPGYVRLSYAIDDAKLYDGCLRIINFCKSVVK